VAPLEQLIQTQKRGHRTAFSSSGRAEYGKANDLHQSRPVSP
jgi:hypothetical protein